MVDRQHPYLSLVRQCGSRSSPYYRPRPASSEDLSIDRQYLEPPFFGFRRMKA